MSPSSANSSAEVYRSLIIDQAPRVLSLVDREWHSPTRGCCDRTFWAWKFVDFPGARFQEALCVLSFLYATNFEKNPYYQNSRLLEWIDYGLQYWSSLAHPDGSFDEAYPFERSLAATAFTSFYIGEALAFIESALDASTVESVRKTMVNAGKWLIRNEEHHGFLSNHLAAAAAALRHVYRVSGDESFEARSRYFLQRIMDRQSQEGWYEEYGGADPGYQTHGSFYLTRCWQLSGQEDIASSLDRAMTFLAHFVHPDGSIGGEYASRNTQTYYPAAFEMFAIRNPAAAWIAETMRSSVASGAAAGMRCIDVYNYFPFLNNLVFAYLACADKERATVAAEEPSCGTGLVWFPEAGIARVRRDGYDAYVGAAKGAVIKVFDRDQRRRAYSDCGYIGRLHNGQTISTQHHRSSEDIQVDQERIQVRGTFAAIARPTMSPLRFLAFRLFTLTVGRIPSSGRWIKNLLVKVLIYRKRELDLHYCRTIEFDDGSVRVRDEISGPSGNLVSQMRWAEVFSTIHMGSSRYFIENELDEGSFVCEGARFEVDPAQISSGVTLERTVVLQKGIA